MTRAQQLRGEVSGVAHESFDGALVVKTLGREADETERFRDRAHELRDTLVQVGRVRGLFDPVMEALPTLGVLVVLLVGTARVGSGAIDAGQLVRVAYLFTLLAFPVRAIGWVLNELPRSVVGWDRVQRVLTAEGSQVHGPARLPADGGPDRGGRARGRLLVRPRRGAARRRLRGRSRPHGGRRRADRLGQVHPRDAARAPGRPGRRRGVVRRRRPARARARRARRRRRPRAAVGLPVRRLRARQPDPRRRPARRGRSGRRCGSRRPTGSSRPCRPGSTRWWASAARACREGSGSVSRWPAPWCAGRA